MRTRLIEYPYSYQSSSCAHIQIRAGHVRHPDGLVLSITKRTRVGDFILLIFRMRICRLSRPTVEHIRKIWSLNISTSAPIAHSAHFGNELQNNLNQWSKIEYLARLVRANTKLGGLLAMDSTFTCPFTWPDFITQHYW